MKANLLIACAVASYAAVFAFFNYHVPEAYMDEVFHVPQTQRYCRGEWAHWDPKITTFPGLYAIGAAAGRAATAVSPHLPLCSVQTLRAVNAALALACLPIFYYLAAALDANRTPQQLILMTATCALFPLHFFYSFLYYTDVASTLFTLAAWLAATKGRFRLSALLGAAAVLMRQTNAVWVAFIAARAALEACLPPKKGPKGSKNQAAFVSSLLAVLRQAWALRGHLLAQLWPLAILIASFAGFVVINGGIVVGDKENHSPVRHLAQPLYCALYCTICIAPVFWTPARVMRISRAAGRRPIMASAAVLAAFTMISEGTLVHPFLLADNRHYTFYLWRRVIDRTPWARYALILAYVFSLFSLDARLAAAGRHALERVLLAGAACVVLVPAHLIEFRYFTMPFFATLLLMKAPTGGARLATTAAAFAACNAATLYVFAARPFRWADGSVARFMW